MKKLLRIICWIKGIYWTYLYSTFISISIGAISGHDYELIEGPNPRVETLVCKICGKVSVGIK